MTGIEVLLESVIARRTSRREDIAPAPVNLARIRKKVRSCVRICALRVRAQAQGASDGGRSGGRCVYGVRAHL